MPYYHVRITQRGRTKDAIGLNFSEKYLVNLILEKYRLRQKFACGNESVNPSDVLGIKITKSEQPLGYGHRDYFKLEYEDLWRRMEDQEDVTETFAEYIPKSISEPIQPSRNVFVAHGRERKPLKELKTMLQGFGLNPIVLHEKPSGSRTVVEKLEKYSDVGYAFVILTPEDGSFNLAKLDEFLARVEAMSISEKKRDDLVLDALLGNLVKVARQNVILEFGYFMGLLGRDRVCCLYKGEVELPSDMHGIVYIPFKESVDEAREKIRKELEEAGYKDLKRKMKTSQNFKNVISKLES